MPQSLEKQFLCEEGYQISDNKEFKFNSDETGAHIKVGVPSQQNCNESLDFKGETLVITL